MKDIVILADFCGPLDGTFDSRFLYIADMLEKENEVEIITSDFNHGKKEYFQDEIEFHNYPITMLHEGSYCKNISIKRFYSHYIWGSNVKKYLKERKKPDVIYCAIPTLKASYEAAKFCQKNNIRFVIDIQDLWPEAFQMVFNIPILSPILYMPFKFIANGIYKRADAICAVSETYAQRAKRANKKVKETTTVYLGTDLSRFDNYASAEPCMQKKDGEIWLAYCGSLANSYDLTCAIESLAILNDPRIRFIIMGDGAKRKEFEECAISKGVSAIFTGRLSYDAMCSLLCVCDITINPIAHMAAASIINKHADYAASGLPVVNTQESQEYRNLVEEYNMGFNCRNNDAKDLSEKIAILIKDEKLRKQMGRNARLCAEERFNRSNTYKLLVDQIMSR